MHYTGWLDNFESPKKFDSSYDRGKPLSFRAGVGQVIQGWDEAVLQMKVGEKRQVIIPPSIGYGARGIGPIPPNRYGHRQAACVGGWGWALVLTSRSACPHSQRTLTQHPLLHDGAQVHRLKRKRCSDGRCKAPVDIGRARLDLACRRYAAATAVAPCGARASNDGHRHAAVIAV